MKILFLTQLLPFPLDSGAKVRAHFTIRYLARHHQVTLLSFVRPEDSADSVKALQSICAGVYEVPIRRSASSDLRALIRALPSSRPALLWRDWQNGMIRRVSEFIAGHEYDAVHADQIWMAPYALHWKHLQPEVRIVLDQHNATFSMLRRLASSDPNPFRRLLLRIEAVKMQRFEAAAVRDFDRVVWVSGNDRQLFGKASQRASSGFIIPIGIEVADSPGQQNQVRFRATFIGSYNWPSNVEAVIWFLKEVWPGVHRSHPHLTLTLIGRNPPRALDRLARSSPAVEVTGYVADPQPLLAETAVFLVPILSGSGLRVKILDAWNYGLPVVSTTLGAEGIRTTPGTDILVADTAARFAAAVSRVAGDRQLAGTLSRGGRASVARDYSWRSLYPAWDEVYREQAG